MILIIAAWGDLVPRPGIDPGLLALGARSRKPLNSQGSLNLRIILQAYMELPDGGRSSEQNSCPKHLTVWDSKWPPEAATLKGRSLETCELSFFLLAVTLFKLVPTALPMDRDPG